MRKITSERGDDAVDTKNDEQDFTKGVPELYDKVRDGIVVLHSRC
jgi:hypothetical protein